MKATLEAVRRERFGKNEANRLRSAGRIPAVLYGDTKKAESISVDPKALLQILRSESGAITLIVLTLVGVAETCVYVKELQYHSVVYGLLSADFSHVAM